MPDFECHKILNPPNILNVDPYTCNCPLGRTIVAPNGMHGTSVSRPDNNLVNTSNMWYSYRTRNLSMEMWFYPTRRGGYNAVRPRGGSATYAFIGARDDQLGAGYWDGAVYYLLDWGPIGSVRRWRYMAANFDKSSDEIWVNVDGLSWAGPIAFNPAHDIHGTGGYVFGHYETMGAAVFIWSGAVHDDYLLTDRDIDWALRNQDTNVIYGNTVARHRFVDLYELQADTISYVPNRIADSSGVDDQVMRGAPYSRRLWQWWDQVTGDGATSPLVPTDPMTGAILANDIDFGLRPDIAAAYPNACVEGWIANSQAAAGAGQQRTTRLMVRDSSAQARDIIPIWPNIPGANWDEEPHWRRDVVVDHGVDRQRLMYCPNDDVALAAPELPADWTQ